MHEFFRVVEYHTINENLLKKKKSTYLYPMLYTAHSLRIFFNLLYSGSK